MGKKEKYRGNTPAKYAYKIDGLEQKNHGRGKVDYGKSGIKLPQLFFDTVRKITEICGQRFMQFISKL